MLMTSVQNMQSQINNKPCMRHEIGVTKLVAQVLRKQGFFLIAQVSSRLTVFMKWLQAFGP